MANDVPECRLCSDPPRPVNAGIVSLSATVMQDITYPLGKIIMQNQFSMAEHASTPAMQQMPAMHLKADIIKASSISFLHD